MPKRNLFLAAAVVAVLLFLGGFGMGRGSANADALAANRRADSLAVVIAERNATAGAVLAGNDVVVDSAAKVVARAAPAKSRVRAVDVAALPDTCKPVVQTILAAADTVFVADSTALALHEAQNARLAGQLASTTALLEDARLELRTQATRVTAPAPKKFLGLLPAPALTAGYGATLANGRVYTGPQVGISFKVVL